MKVKGFTLVEIAIVLVVIGIILGMALKARGIVELARFKREASLVLEMNNAYMSYVALNGQNYSKRPGLTLNMTHFEEFIPSSKRYSEMIRDSWQFTWCRLSSNKAYPSVGYLEPHVDGQYVCTSINKKLSAELACYIDYLTDDSLWTSGQGRVYNDGGAALYEGDLTGKCHKLTPLQTTDTLQYMWLNKLD